MKTKFKNLSLILLLIFCSISIISGCSTKDNDSPAINLTTDELNLKFSDAFETQVIMTGASSYWYHSSSNNNTISSLKLKSIQKNDFLEKLPWSTNPDNNGWYIAELNIESVTSTFKLRYFPASNKTEVQIYENETITSSIDVTKNKNGLWDATIFYTTDSHLTTPATAKNITGKEIISLFDPKNGCGIFDLYITADLDNNQTLNNSQRWHLEVTFQQNAPSTEKPIKLTGWLYKEDIKKEISEPIYIEPFPLSEPE